MKVISISNMQCPCCMNEHPIQAVLIREQNHFKNTDVEYEAEYYYCEQADAFYADERQLSSNDSALKDAYRKQAGLLTSQQIAELRSRYGISQKDLSLLLGWGAKTVTRYETHQVQDAAHDTILRKLDSDPEWFLLLLDAAKNLFSAAVYEKYRKSGMRLFEQNHAHYWKSAILSQYARFFQKSELTGGKSLSLDVVAEMIRHYANSPGVTNLFLVKLLKMLWYADALSYKRRGYSISGLVYRAMPMGAVPVGYESILDFDGVRCEEVDLGEGTGYLFLPVPDKTYPLLNREDIEILETVIRQFGCASKDHIITAMHQEDAYKKTALNGFIPFEYTRTLLLT